jgi:hypothetical protein
MSTFYFHTNGPAKQACLRHYLKLWEAHNLTHNTNVRKGWKCLKMLAKDKHDNQYARA